MVKTMTGKLPVVYQSNGKKVAGKLPAVQANGLIPEGKCIRMVEKIMCTVNTQT
jgi:hypothetical protein